jgi:hypothetical protein
MLRSSEKPLVGRKIKIDGDEKHIKIPRYVKDYRLYHFKLDEYNWRVKNIGKYLKKCHPRRFVTFQELLS